MSALDAAGVLIAASRDRDAKVTFLSDGWAAKIATTEGAAAAIAREVQLLAAVRASLPPALADTVPRLLDTTEIAGRPALRTSLVRGAPLTVRYHRPGHTSRPRRVRADHLLAESWLAPFQRATRQAATGSTWPGQVAAGLAERWAAHPDAGRALRTVDAAVTRLADRLPVGTSHGDFWPGNVLVEGRRVTGVVDWEHADLAGCPVADLVRFALSYALYLDRHTREGAPVRGHRPLVRQRFGAGIRHALVDAGWYPDLVRGFVAEGLVRIGVRQDSWYDACLVGLAEIARTANDEAFAAGHLSLLAGLPETRKP